MLCVCVGWVWRTSSSSSSSSPGPSVRTIFVSFSELTFFKVWSLTPGGLTPRQPDPVVPTTKMPMGEPPPLYKPELIEPKKRLTILQRCYKEPWVPIGALAPAHTPHLAARRCSLPGVASAWPQAA